MREAHKDLEWFGPPERNTQRPLRVVLPELRVCSLSPRGGCVRLVYRVCPLFYMPKRSTYTERGPDMWTWRCIINYSLAFNAPDPEILLSAFMRSF